MQGSDTREIDQPGGARGGPDEDARHAGPDVHQAPDANGRERVGFGKRLVDSVREDDVTGLAAELAYRFLFAVFPFGLFVAALSAFVAAALQIENPAAQIAAGLADNLPPSIAQALQPELERLVNSPRADILSFGAIAALWAATGGTNALIKGIHRAYDVPEARPFLLRYAVAIGLTLVMAVGILASFVTIVGGALLTEQVAEQFGVGAQVFGVLQLLRWPVVFLALTAAVAILYRYAPNIVVPWRWILVGSGLFTIAWLLATAGLGLYVANFADYGATYGSLAGVVILMLWFYITSAVLILGAEVAAALALERTPEQIHPRREEQQAGAAVSGAIDHATEGVKTAARRGSDRLSRPPA